MSGPIQIMSVGDIFRTQMMMSMDHRNALRNLSALNVFDIAIKTFPQWSGWFRPARRRSVSWDDVSYGPCVHHVRARHSECDQQQGSAGRDRARRSRMDAVVYYVTISPRYEESTRRHSP
jgi:hypothetical protein